MSGRCASVSATASAPFLRLGDDLELGPDLGQPRAQLLAQQPLVVGDEGASSWAASAHRRGPAGRGASRQSSQPRRTSGAATSASIAAP